MNSHKTEGEAEKNQNEQGSSALGFVHKKTEKLVTAVYMLSNFFPHEEPLKWKVRTTSLSLLSGISSVFYGTEGERRSVFKEHTKIIDEIIMFLELSRIVGLISHMNFSVIKNEFLSLKKEIEANENSTTAHGLLFSTDFFATDKLLENDSKPNLNIISDTEHPISHPTLNAPRSVASVHKGTQEKALISSHKSEYTLPRQKNKAESKGQSDDGSIASQRKNDRSEAILKLLKKKDNLTVKDISHVISDCSEKTIQRELLALVSKNVLKKIGERRWSRYSLV